MENQSFLKGMGLGMTAGVTLAVLFRPKHQTMRSAAGKVIRAVGEVVENFSDAIGM